MNPDNASFPYAQDADLVFFEIETGASVMTRPLPQVALTTLVD